MKSTLLFLMLSFVLLAQSLGCRNAESTTEESQSSATKDSEAFRPSALGMNLPLLTKQEQLDTHIGKLVAIRGIVSESKIATIIGVDVDTSPELRGKDCYAVGILAKWTTTQQQVDTTTEDQRAVATRRPGTTYKLYVDLSGKGADARQWPKDSEVETD